MAVPIPDCAIRTQDLRKVYSLRGRHPVEALKGINLEIPRGSIFGLLGPNGAGKSTFINIIADLVKKTSGTAEVWGYDIDDQRRQASACVGIVPQELTIDPFFTPRETLDLQAGYYGVPANERQTSSILAALGLADGFGRRVRPFLHLRPFHHRRTLLYICAILLSLQGESEKEETSITTTATATAS